MLQDQSWYWYDTGLLEMCATIINMWDFLLKICAIWIRGMLFFFLQAHKLDEKEKELQKQESLFKEHVGKLEAKVSDILSTLHFSSFTNARLAVQFAGDIFVMLVMCSGFSTLTECSVLQSYRRQLPARQRGGTQPFHVSSESLNF